MSVARLLANANNAVPAATVTASSVAPAARTVFRRQTVRQGNGEVVLAGGYTGANDATIEVEIRPADGAAARVSKPVFSGAGNGAITQPTAVDGTASQTVTVTLVDLGTETTTATATLWGDLLLRAKASGSAGNNVRLTVLPQLTLGAVKGALSVALDKDTQEWTDQRHDFGAAALHPDGTLPANAPRLVFAGDLSRVYRHYKRWDGAQWQYGVSPKTAAGYAAQSTVHAVAGAYAAIVTDGVDTEVYSGLVTLYDVLVALAPSALAEVAGVVANDATPNGVAAIDLPLRTTAFALPAVKSDSKRLPDLTGVTVATVAPAETVTLRCKANAPVGAEFWSVTSKVSGALPDAKTGTAYTASPYVGFTVPVAPLDSDPITGRIAIVATRFANADTTVGIPAICLYRPALGAKATGRTLNLVWTPRPASDCNCADAAVTGGPTSACLGINVTGEEAFMAIPAWYSTRLQTAYGWRSGFVASNTALTAQGELRAAKSDIDLADTATAALSRCLADLYAAFGDTSPAAPALAAWDAAMTGLDADLMPLAATGSETPALSYPPILQFSGGVAVLGAAPANGTIYTMPGSDGRAHRYQVVTSSSSGTPEQYGPLPDHIDGGFFESAFADAGGRAHVVWQDLGPVGDTEDANSTATLAGDPGIARDPASFALRYTAKMDHVRALAGLVPKSDAGGNGSACWQDPGDAYYWHIEGTDLMPVFNNVYYHSCAMDGDTVVPTHEFGFALRVSCADRLVAGDRLTLEINDVAAHYPYQIGDTYEIPLVAGGPLLFAGGMTGTDTLTWQVASSAGPLPDYALTAAEAAYAGGGLGFALHRGGLAFALGDQFRFGVTAGGRFRWRKDDGAWSADLALLDDSALAAGLTVSFVAGATPDFVAGDLHRFAVTQPNSPSHSQSAHGETWRWSGSTATLTLAWASDQTVGVVGLLRHDLAAPANVTIELRDSANALLATLTPSVKAGPLVVPLPSPLVARQMTLTVANAADMAVGWVYAGVPFATDHNPSIRLQRHYAIERGSEPNPRGAYLGAGRGGEIGWENWLLQSELDALLALVDHCKTDGDAPIVLLPHILHPQDAALARIDSDAITIEDYFDYQPTDAAKRRLSLTLPLAPVLL